MELKLFLIALASVYLSVFALVYLVAAGTVIARHLKAKRYLRENPPFNMSDWPSELPSLGEFVAGVRERAISTGTSFTCDPALSAHAGPLATWIGDVVVGAPGETWPERNGRPMVGICQFNLTQCPAKPKCLEGIALMAMFVERQPGWNDVKWPGVAGWTSEEMIIRTYPWLNNLVPYADRPGLPNPYKPCAARPALLVEYEPDYPEIEETRGRLGLPESWSALLNKTLFHEALADDVAVFGTKVGGWPAAIQETSMRPLALQLGGDDAVGMEWGDAGNLFVWKEGAVWKSRIDYH